MSTYDWPTGRAFQPRAADAWLEGTDLTTRSVLGGGVQTSGTPGALWRMALTFGQDLEANRNELIGFLRSLNGKEHRVRLYDMRKFGVGGWGYPAGTINTTGVTIKNTVAQFGTSVVFAACGNAKTLKPGDMWSVNGQLVENGTLCTADAGGDMTVPVPERLRAQAAAGAPVTLIKPYALFVLAAPFHSPRNKALYDEIVVEFEEVLS